MTNAAPTTSRARRIRNALLASVFTLGIAGAAGTGLLSNSHFAFADPVKVDAATPADFSAVVEQVAPAVVSVQVKTEVAAVANRGMPEGFDDLPPGLEKFFRRFQMPGDEDNRGNRREPYHPRRGMSQGSGFFISDDGYVVTNSHVVSGATGYTVVTQDGKELNAKLIGKDERTDLALLKVEGSNFKYVSFAPETPKVGQWVLAVGNPFGLGGSVTAGIISAAGRDIGSGPYDNFLQIDAPVNRGNSGGPTFNVHGQVVGVNTAIFSPSGGNVGIAFAIPANTVSEIVSDLKAKGVVTRGWLGVQIQPVTDDIAKSLGIESTNGAMVADATADGPARGAGIKTGDIITKVNGTEVASPRELSETIARLEPGAKVKVTLMRDGKEQSLDVTLGNLGDFDKKQLSSNDNDNNSAAPEDENGSLAALGMTIEPNPDGEGVRVASVDEDSPAGDKGLAAGDVIVAVGSKSVNSVSDVEAGVASAQDQGRDAVLFRVQGEQGSRFVGVPFERG